MNHLIWKQASIEQRVVYILDRNFHPTILRRGFMYYENHHIIDLSTEDYVHFVAVIEGTKMYLVQIDFFDDYVNMECNCPCHFTCKHIVASLYAIVNQEVSTPSDYPNQENVVKLHRSFATELMRMIGSYDDLFAEDEWSDEDEELYIDEEEFDNEEWDDEDEVDIEFESPAYRHKNAVYEYLEFERLFLKYDGILDQNKDVWGSAAILRGYFSIAQEVYDHRSFFEIKDLIRLYNRICIKLVLYWPDNEEIFLILMVRFLLHRESMAFLDRIVSPFKELYGDNLLIALYQKLIEELKLKKTNDSHIETLVSNLEMDLVFVMHYSNHSDYQTTLLQIASHHSTIRTMELRRLHQQQLYREAITFFEQTFHHKSNSQESWMILSKTYHCMGDLEHAKSSMVEGFLLKPSKLLFDQLSEFFSNKHWVEDAKAVLSRLLSTHYLFVYEEICKTYEFYDLLFEYGKKRNFFIIYDYFDQFKIAYSAEMATIIEENIYQSIAKASNRRGYQHAMNALIYLSRLPDTSTKIREITSFIRDRHSKKIALQEELGITVRMIDIERARRDG